MYTALRDLTEEQMDIAQALAIETLTEAASQLGMSVSTLRYHADKIYVIAEVDNKNELRQLMRHHGLI